MYGISIASAINGCYGSRIGHKFKLGHYPFEELLRAMMMEQDATRRVLVRKGLLTNEEVLEEIKVVRREMEGKRGR